MVGVVCVYVSAANLAYYRTHPHIHECVLKDLSWLIHNFWKNLFY